MGTFLVSAVNIALPTIEHDFSLTAIQLSWIITSFLLGTSLFMLPSGSWGDRSDNRKLFKLGLLIFTAASAVCYFAPGGYWLIAARFLQGVGTAFMNTTGQAILVSSFPANKRGQVLGISVASVYVGLALGPLIGGIITQHAGWRFLFLIAVLFGIGCIWIAHVFLKSEKKRSLPEGEADKKGTLLFMSGLTAMVFGSSQIPDLLGWALMGIALILLIVFWRYESTLEHPLVYTGRSVRHPPLYSKPALRVFQPIGPDQLYRHLCHCFLPQPLPAKDTRAVAPRRGSRDRSTTGNDGSLLARGGKIE